ncbi:MAG TPA: TMEM175 family protein [Caulobacteraceae bacterium]|nr:TMEM175 family protein [Caulobacteraceae bacterium]
MGKGRLEAFSDGVVAIIITIMVLELHPPERPTLEALRPLAPVFAAYVLSFVNVGIYWNNHHHMLHVARSVTGAILWANMHLLFWLSLFPFATAWIGESAVDTIPVAAYGGVLVMAAVAYTILATLLVRHEGPDSTLAKAFGADVKGKVSLALYATGIALSFVRPWLGIACYVIVAVIWFIPDRRIERVLKER